MGSHDAMVISRCRVVGRRGLSCRTYLVLLLLLFVGVPMVHAQSPVLFFSDLDSGPNTGGESVSGSAGAYVTLYGNFLGSSQGSSAVTWNGLNCLRVVPATGSYTGWGSPRFWYQSIVVQLGSGCATGTGNFVVTVNGVPSNGIPFTVRSGSIYFVSTGGNDSNPGTAASPFKTITNCRTVLKAGGTCYIENGVNQNTLDNFDATLDVYTGGTAGQPIALVGYPGATVNIGGTCCTYGLRVPNLGVAANYVTVAELSFNPGPGEALNSTSGSTNWRVVGNKFQCPGANGQVGCFETNETTYLYFYGNETTNVGQVAGTKQQHADYLSSDTNHVWFGWNYIHNNNSCRGLQVHSSPLNGGGASDPTGYNQYDLHIHDNLIHDDPCDGIELATVDPSKGTVEVYNNVVYHVGLGPDPNDGEASYSCIRIAQITNDGPPGTGQVAIYNNTLSDCGSHVGSFDQSGTYAFAAGSVGATVSNNIASQNSGEFFVNSGVAASGITLSGTANLWYGGSQLAPSWSSGNITSNPLFANLGAFDFHLTSTSPAVGTGTSAGTSTFDFDGRIRPTPPSVGAYEVSSGVAVQRPNPPTNLSVTVQ
jgi:hypothetical protein